MLSADQVDLSVEIAGIQMKSPIMPASGCFGYGEEFAQIEGFQISKLGAIVSKGTTLLPREGNPQPRICEHKGGMVNWIGLENPGIDEVIAKIPFMAQFGVPVIINISGFTIEEFAHMAILLDPIKTVSAIEVNISCPNVEGGRIPFGCDPLIAAEVVKAVREVTNLPLIVKLTPNVTPDKMIGVIAEAVEAARADAISMINTVKVENVGGIKLGGLSGRPIKQRALELIKIVSRSVSLPIIGMGGIYTVEDVVEFLKVGCSAVAVGTANFSNPLVMMKLINELGKYCLENNITNLSQI